MALTAAISDALKTANSGGGSGMAFDPLSGLAGIAGAGLQGLAGGGPAVSGLTDTGYNANSTGSNFVNVGNPLQNVGQILQAINSGGAVQGQTFVDFPSAYTSGLNQGSGVTATVGIPGVATAGLSLGGYVGIGLAAFAVFLFVRKK